MWPRSKIRMVGVVLALGAGGMARGADRFDVVPEVYTRSPQVFRELFRRAQTSTVRALMMGDSQETSPGGQGVIYVPRWNAELHDVYGNAPETPLVQMLSSTGGGLPWGDWLVSSALAAPGPTQTRLAAAQVPPNFGACKVSVNNGNNVNANQWLGQLIGLQPRAELCDPGSRLPNAAEYFRAGTSVYVEVLAAGNESSGEVRVDAKPVDGTAPNFFVPISSTDASSMGLHGSPGAIRHQRLGPFTFGGRDHLQVEVSGTDATRFTDVIGARFVSAVDAHGWVVQSVSAAGYTSASVLASHGQCGPVLAAVGAQVAILCYGANDSTNSGGMTVEEFRRNIEALIAFLRQHHGPRFPIILVADPWRWLTIPQQIDALDRYPGVCYDIARSDPYVCALNSRRMLDALGWNEVGQLRFVSDLVHYTPEGAITKARVEVRRMVQAFGPGSCPADLDDGSGLGVGDGGVTTDDLLYFLAAYATGDPSADMDDGSGSGTPDGGVTIDDLLYYLSRFADGC